MNTTQHTKNNIAAPTPVIPCASNDRVGPSIARSRVVTRAITRRRAFARFVHIARIARTLDTHARNDPTAYAVTFPRPRAPWTRRGRATREAPEDEMRSVATDRQTASRHGMGEDAPSASARTRVVPLGATKTLYLIRHAEGFHNQGASTRADDEKIIDLMSDGNERTND